MRRITNNDAQLNMSKLIKSIHNHAKQWCCVNIKYKITFQHLKSYIDWIGQVKPIDTTNHVVQYTVKHRQLIV